MSTSRSRTGEHKQRQPTSPLAAVGAGRGERQNSDGAQFGAHAKWAVVASIGSAALIAFVSLVGLLPSGEQLYGTDTWVTSGVVTSTAGIVIPGFRAHDLFNLAVALPVLLASVWLAQRGSLFGLLLWPGALFYVLYTYALYLVGAPFGPLFLGYVLLVVLSAYTMIDDCSPAAPAGKCYRSDDRCARLRKLAGGGVMDAKDAESQRLKILRLLYERDQTSSAYVEETDIAEVVGLSLRDVHYHLDALQDEGYADVMRTQGPHYAALSNARAQAAHSARWCAASRYTRASGE